MKRPISGTLLAIFAAIPLLVACGVADPAPATTIPAAQVATTVPATALAGATPNRRDRHATEHRHTGRDPDDRSPWYAARYGDSDAHRARIALSPVAR